MRPSGYLKELWSPKDYSFDKSFPSNTQEEIKPLGRKSLIDGLNLPPISQGNKNTCVACAVTFAKQFQEISDKALSYEWLARESDTLVKGAKPSWVLEKARLNGIAEKEFELETVGAYLNAQGHKLRQYFYLEDLGRENVYKALKEGIVLVGLLNWNGVKGGHYLALVDVDKQGNWIAANWWVEGVQEYVTLNKDIVFTDAVLVPTGMARVPARIGFIGWLSKTLPFILSFRSVKASIASILVALAGFAGTQIDKPDVYIQNVSNEGIEQVKEQVDNLALETQLYGSLSLPGKYRTTLRSDITSTGASMPVSTMTLRTGESITTSTIQFPVYLTINTGGGTEEDVECNALDTAGPSFINCTGRGLSLLGGNTTSSVAGKAYPHSAGESVILSTTPYAFNRFVDNFTAQSVTGTKTFVAYGGRIDVGDNTTGTGKKINFQVGQTNEPYFKVVGPSGNMTTSTFYFSVDGTSDLQLNASGTTVGVSSTAGLFLTNGQFGINNSSTGGIIFDSAGLALVNVSSTASNNGGFIQRLWNDAGRLYWDIAAFLSGSWTWTGNNTSTGIWAVQTPTSTMDAANKGYVDAGFTSNFATGTAGIAITAGQALYISTTGTLFLADSDATSTAFTFAGVAITSAAQSAEVRYAKPGGTVDGLSGLITGRNYYLSGTSGALSLTAGTVSVRMGLALSSSRIMVQTPSFWNRVSGGLSGWDGGSSATATLGWIPTRVDAICNTDSDQGSMGWWMSRSNGGSSQVSHGTDDDAAPFAQYNNGFVCKWEEGTNVFSAFLVTTTNGFAFYSPNLSSPRSFEYTAVYEPDGGYGY